MLPTFSPEYLDIAQVLIQHIKPSPQGYLDVPLKHANLAILHYAAFGLEDFAYYCYC